MNSTRKIILTACLAMAVAAGVLLAVRATGTTSKSNKLQVTASFYPLYDFARAVGGPYVQVTNITPAGAEPHDYEPSPKALAAAKQSSVFIYNGATMEPWVPGFLTDYTHTAVKSSTGIALHNAADEEDASRTVQDPHFWLDPVLAQTMVRTIRDGLIAADPTHQSAYTANANAYIAQLQQLDRQFATDLRTCQTRTIITSHAAFGYVGTRYTIHVIAIAGVSPDEEPSPARLAQLSQLVRDNNLHYVFFESLVSPRLANTIAQESGAQTLAFDPLEGVSNAEQAKGANYLSIQRQNLQALRTALACQ